TTSRAVLSCCGVVWRSAARKSASRNPGEDVSALSSVGKWRWSNSGQVGSPPQREEGTGQGFHPAAEHGSIKIGWFTASRRGMKETRPSLRIVTYNVHKCRGVDRRVRPDRIVEVLRELRPDIVALQEVVSLEGGSREEDQARFVAGELGFHFAFGENQRHKGGRYGNVVLTRFPIQRHQNYDISAGGRERRGCLRTDVRFDDSTLHVFNVHFGTRFFEQRKQARKLFDEGII